MIFHGQVGLPCWVLMMVKPMNPGHQYVWLGSKPWYLVNPKIAGKWMFIPLKMYLWVLIHPHVWLGMDWEQKNTFYIPVLWVLLNGEASPKIINAAIPSTPTQQYDFLPTTMVCQALSCHQCLSSASLFQLFAVPPRNLGGCRG